MILVLFITTNPIISKQQKHISDDSISFIIQEESFRTHAYTCSAGQWTIGYGTTYYSNKSRVQKGDSITKNQAYSDMIHHLNVEVYPYIKDILHILNDNETIAITSFVYNLGGPKFKKSSVYKHLKNGDKLKASKSMLRYISCKNCNKNALLKRRLKEYNMFLNK